MSITTNIIQNVYNMGGSSVCDAGTSYCSEGYALYFPCLKDITRGQDVCFEFYVTDLATQDVVDLDTVDALTLTLSGLYGCEYGNYSYPDNIFSLQQYSYVLKYDCSFDNRELCQLKLIMADINEFDNTYIKQKTSEFYAGTKVEVAAYDTAEYIFLGWAVFEELDGECDEESIEDYILSTEHIYSFIIQDDINVYALYRPRKTYDIVVDSLNKNSHYNVIYKSVVYHLSNRDETIFDDGYDKVSVLEGYAVKVECIPNNPTLDSESDSEDDYAYRFSEWKDGNEERIRILHAGVDTEAFEEDNEIKLFSICYGPVEPYEIENDLLPVISIFDSYDGIYINTAFSSESESVYTGDEYTKSVENVYLKSIEENVYLLINNGKLVLDSMDITEGIKIDIQAIADDSCDLIVKVNGTEISNTISSDDSDENKMYSYYFSVCNGSDIEIRTSGKCLISDIEVYKVNITDKGKAMFCLNNDTVIRNDDGTEVLFEDIPTGPLYVGGAIMVNGNSYGLAKTQIGTVNRLNKITIQ